MQNVRHPVRVIKKYNNQTTMKTAIRTTLLLLICLFAIQLPATAGDDRPISISQLPAAAQQLIKKHFPNRKVALAKMESGLFDREYDIIFTNGEKIEFDKRGNWTEIDCKHSSVPASLIPVRIANYVKMNYPGCHILKIEADDDEYEVKLSNRIAITFNKKFQATDIE